MSAKLVVHKFGSGINSKFLQITIENVDDDSNEARFSEWSEDQSQQEEKDSKKSKTIIVGKVSGSASAAIELDSCASRLDDDAQLYYADSSERRQNLMCSEMNEPDIANSSSGFRDVDFKYENKSYADYNTYNSDENMRDGMKMTANAPPGFQSDAKNSTPNSLEDLNPLEYSLERVKENNARIMENIHMLNRTLSYTKKKEILDIVYPKVMRYPCNTCGKCFVYETGLKRHYSMRHSINEIQPRWQTVWTCIECFQVWPRVDLAVKHALKCYKGDNTNTDYAVREIKTSSLLQCEFCEKVFTSIPRLLRHSKVHTTANNYECNACESTFMSYKAAEQHWLLCPWLKMCYSFSLPKMLLCNACDRKFKNYEQLYNHRYKVGHFLTKTQCNKSLGLLVYQCEMCSQWFSSITSLQSHRSQHHSFFDAGLQNKIDNYKDYDNNYLEPGEIDC